MCFAAVYFGWAVWFVVAVVAAMVEYEQKYQFWTYHWTWWDYIRYKAAGDLVADSIGIVGGLLL